MKILDINLRTMSTNELVQFAHEEVATCAGVIVKNNPMTVEEYESICLRMGKCAKNFLDFETSKHYAMPTAPHISRVTPRKDDKGRATGLFPDGELEWHNTFHNNADNEPYQVVSLYVEVTEGTGTIIADTTKALNSMDKSTVEELRSVYGVYGFVNQEQYIHNLYAKYDETSKHIQNRFKKPQYQPRIRPLVNTHPLLGHDVLFYPEPTIRALFDINDKRKKVDHVFDILNETVFSEKFVEEYKADVGDILFMDQWNGIHKRMPLKGDRMLWRANWGYLPTN